MHGPGWGWHRSHHTPRPARWQRNDRYPLVFAAATVAAMAVGLACAGVGPAPARGRRHHRDGAAYVLAHDVYVHRRVPLLPERVAGVDRLRVAHERHHATGGEPYGFLLPVTGSRGDARRHPPGHQRRHRRGLPPRRHPRPPAEHVVAGGLDAVEDPQYRRRAAAMQPADTGGSRATPRSADA